MLETEGLPAWDEVKVSLLASRDHPSSRHRTVAIEAKTFRDPTSLNAFINRHSQELRELIWKRGSIVFRGFEVNENLEFEAALLSLQPIAPLSGYFLQEEGRDRIPGTQFVFATNTKIKTGGGFELDNFHAENYFSPDVPGLQSFWCKVAPPFGGNTALVQSADVYERLSQTMKEKLERQAVRVVERPLSMIAQDNGLDEQSLEAFCKQEGFELTDRSDGKCLRLTKAPVLKHPVTGRKALQVHLSFQSPALNLALRKHMITGFRGTPWIIHKLYWKLEPLWQPLIKASVETVFRIEQRIKKRSVSKNTQPVAKSPAGTSDGHSALPTRFGSDLTSIEVETLASEIWQNTYLHSWQKGDIFIFDNIQTLHGGLPGLGERELMVMLCDPLSMSLRFSSGFTEPSLPSAGQSTIWERLQAFKKSHSHN